MSQIQRILVIRVTLLIRPTGAVRVSIGRTNTEADILSFVNFVRNYFITRMPEQIVPTPPSGSLRISSIYVYPVKSCGGIRVRSSWPLSPSGFLYDRFFALVDEEGTALDQKRYPQMCLIIPEIDLDSHIMTVSFRGQSSSSYPPLRVKLLAGSGLEEKTETFSICERDMSGVACSNGKAVNSWFSQVLGVQCRLVRSPKRRKKESFANRGQILAISEASVDWLRSRLGAKGASVNETSFRANIVVAGKETKIEQYGTIHFLAAVFTGSNPHEEDKWSSMTCNESRFEVAGKFVKAFHDSSHD